MLEWMPFPPRCLYVDFWAQPCPMVGPLVSSGMGCVRLEAAWLLLTEASLQTPLPAPVHSNPCTFLDSWKKSHKPAWNHLFHNTHKADVMVLLCGDQPPFSSFLVVFIPAAIQFCHRNSPTVCAFDLLSLMLICELKFSWVSQSGAPFIYLGWPQGYMVCARYISQFSLLFCLCT